MTREELHAEAVRILADVDPELEADERFFKAVDLHFPEDRLRSESPETDKRLRFAIAWWLKGKRKT